MKLSQVKNPLHVLHFLFVEKGITLLDFPWGFKEQTEAVTNYGRQGLQKGKAVKQER